MRKNIFRHRDLTLSFCSRDIIDLARGTISRNVRLKNLENAFRVARSGWVRSIRCRYRCYTGNSCPGIRATIWRTSRGPRVAAQGRTESIHHGYPQRDAEIRSQLVSSNRRVSCTLLKRASLVIIPISTLSVSGPDIHEYDLSAFRGVQRPSWTERRSLFGSFLQHC